MDQIRIGAFLKALRKEKGLTQEQLAEAVGLSPVFISHVEAPGIDKTVSLGTLFAIAEALDIPAYKFFMFEDDL